MFIPGAIEYNIYLAIQLLTLVCALVMIIIATIHRPSKGQNVVMLFLFSATIYLLGFTIETMSSTVEGFHMACIIEYFGETLVFIAFLHFIAYLCKLRVPMWLYILQGILSVFIDYWVITAQSNHFFYREMYVITDGPFPHVGLVYGPGFYISISYIGLLTFSLLFFVVKYMPKANDIERKRCICTILSVICAWLPYVLKVIGLTGGYEIPGPGMVLGGFWLLLAMVKYGFMDSLVLAGERAIDNGSYAVLVLDSEYRPEYQNEQMVNIIGPMNKFTNIKNFPEIRRIIAGNLEPVHINGKIYDVKMDELLEHGFNQGYMILMFDNTEHYKNIEEIKDLARRDSFTGLYNRTTYQKKLEDYLKQETSGTFVMMDVDDFKLVNDKYGHAIGDEILLILASVLQKLDEKNVLSCRLGGDEFSCYLLGLTDENDVKDVLLKMTNDFKKGLETHGYAKYTSLSIGAVILDNAKITTCVPNFDKLYSYADEVMYEVKHTGKGKFFVRNYPWGR